MKALLIKLNNYYVRKSCIGKHLKKRWLRSKTFEILGISDLMCNETGELVNSFMHLAIVELSNLLSFHILCTWTAIKG